MYTYQTSIACSQSFGIINHNSALTCEQKTIQGMVHLHATFCSKGKAKHGQDSAITCSLLPVPLLYTVYIT